MRSFTRRESKIQTGYYILPIKKQIEIPATGRLLLLLISIVLCSIQGSAQGTWTPLTNTAPHYNEGEMLLLTDGTVIAKTSSGGADNYGNKWDKLTPDIHGSYQNGTWSTIAPMDSTRLYFSSQVLPDGRVYVAGGEYGSGGTQNDVYDPVANTWTTPIAPSIYVISDANSELLSNGKVLQALVDGYGTTHNYLWNPATNSYASGPNCLRLDNEAVWVKLPDNSILFADNYGKTTERYIPATNTWINDALMPVNLYDPYGYESGAAFLLPDGRVFFIGSTPVTAYYTPSGTTALGTWTTGPAIPDTLGAPDAAAAMMVNGKILLALSHTPTDTGNAVFPKPTSFYEFDYTNNTFTKISAPAGGDSLNKSAYITNMLDLPDGNVLYANFGNDQYYIYTPGSAPLPAGKPTIANITQVSCDTFMATGTLFNGITEGAAYGDDWQMSTNYPIVHITSGDSVYYARSFKWNRPGAVMTGSLPDTTFFTLPVGIPYGNYALQVVANGNASDAYNIFAGGPPDATFTVSSNNVAAGTPVTLTYVGNAAAGETYVWSFGGGTATPGTGEGPQTVTWSTPGVKPVTLEIVYAGNCSNISYNNDITVTPSTGLQVTTLENSISISPNPNEGAFDIVFGNAINGPLMVTLTDMQGRVVYKNQFEGVNNKVSVATNNLPNAVYTASININGIVVNKKVVISK